MTRSIPQPSPPGLSPLASLLFARRFVADPRGPIADCTQRFGPVWRSMVPAGGRRHGLVPLVWLMGREGNERILSPTYKDDFTWYDGYCFTMEPLFGRQILLLLDDEPARPGQPKDDAHRRRHRLIVPAFHPRLDDEYLAEIRRIIEVHLSELSTQAVSTAGHRALQIDLQDVVRRVTFHVVASLVLGAPDADPNMPRSQLLHWFEELGHGLFSIVHLNLPGLPFHRATRARAVLSSYLHARLQGYRDGHGSPPPMLRNLLAAQADDPDLLPDEAIVSELISFLYAGYDTTASLLTSAVAALGRYPHVHSRLRSELEQRGDDAGTLSEDSRSDGSERHPYLDALLMESERMYPPLHFLMRGVRHDIEYRGFHIAAGSKVAYSPYFTGRMAELFPQPQRFDPERFLDDRGAVRRPAPYTLLGFGGGHRMCIGKRLAGLELRMFLAQLLARFELAFPPPARAGQSPDDDDDFYFNPALQRRNGCPGLLTPRRRLVPVQASSDRIPAQDTVA